MYPSSTYIFDFYMRTTLDYCGTSHTLPKEKASLAGAIGSRLCSVHSPEGVEDEYDYSFICFVSLYVVSE